VEEYRVIDRLRDTDDGATLRRPLQRGGSLLRMHGLEVHPAFARQLIGGRLLMHALWELSRDSDDLVYLDAFPVRSLFTRERHAARVSADTRAGIVRYYTRLGFYRTEPRAPLTGKKPVRFYRHVGAFGMPWMGWEC
jgi:GNAT superfamily N-acetyltransferase